MILIELRDYIKERKTICVSETALHFKMEQSAIEQLCHELEAKSLIQEIKLESPCASCTMSCKKTSKEKAYKWTG